jgi:hypothetical protein
MVERQLPKLHTRVQFPSPAPNSRVPTESGSASHSARLMDGVPARRRGIGRFDERCDHRGRNRTCRHEIHRALKAVGLRSNPACIVRADDRPICAKQLMKAMPADELEIAKIELAASSAGARQYSRHRSEVNLMPKFDLSSVSRHMWIDRAALAMRFAAGPVGEGDWIATGISM